MAKMSTSDTIQGLVGIVLGSAAVFCGLSDLVFQTSIVKDNGFAVTLLGVIATLVGIDRFTFIKRIESRLDTLDETKEFRDLSGSARNAVSKELTKLVKYQNIKRVFSPGFSILSDEVFKQYSEQLGELISGEINVSGDEALRIQSLLLDNFSHRFDAVSDRDIDFWLGSPDGNSKYGIGREYFRLNYDAYQRNGTACTRIFVFWEEDLKKRKPEITKILREHTQQNIGWGVAIYDRLIWPIANTRGPLDFALFDRDKAYTYFRDRRDSRRFKVIFNMNEHNQSATQQQIDLYRDLLTECWLVSSDFVRSYEDAVDDDRALETIKQKTSKYNASLAKQINSPDFKTEHNVFVIVSDSEQDVAQKVEKLSDILARTEIIKE